MVGDLLTTGVALALVSGPVIEQSPVGAPILRSGGWVGLVALKLFATGTAALAWWVIPRPIAVGIPIGLVLIGGFVTGWNAAIVVVVVAGLR